MSMKDSQEGDKQLGSQIKNAREDKDLTQAEAAGKSGITSNYFAMLERGEANPTWNILKMIFKTVGLKFLIKKG